jgi:cytochrome b involved in lipid metabolism
VRRRDRTNKIYVKKSTLEFRSWEENSSHAYRYSDLSPKTNGIMNKLSTEPDKRLRSTSGFRKSSKNSRNSPKKSKSRSKSSKRRSKRSKSAKNTGSKKLKDYLKLKSYRKYRNLPKISRSRLKRHQTRTSQWMAIRGIVYDVTKYIQDHPGGDVIFKGIGIDATKLFGMFIF